MTSAVHVSLNVVDLTRSTDFYRRFFGEPAKEKPGYIKFVLAEPEIHLALQSAGVAPTRGGALSHLGIRVGSTEEVLRWKGTLSGSGLSPREEMGTACCYARQDKIWIEDPDGNEWEIYTVLEDLKEEGSGTAACCTGANEAVGATAACCTGAARAV